MAQINPSKNILISDLVDWSINNGCFIDGRVYIYCDEITGLSFKAAAAIPSDTRFMKCSFRATLSYLNAIEFPPFHRHDSPPFPGIFLAALQDDAPHIIGNFFLIQQYLLKEKSFWWPYIRLLPQPDEPKNLAIPAWWPEEDQKCLAGTNAEPAIAKRKQLWKADWEKATGLLSGIFDVSLYPLILYQWAATIFGTRSFRASTTISAVLFKDALVNPVVDLLRIRHQIRNDKFSVLLPLVDVGNHNGVRRVKWASDPATACITLTNSSFIEPGDQIYNYYGDKSNTELLVGYGFIIDEEKLDRVNFRVTPPPEAMQLRRFQSSHTRPRQEGSAEEEFMYWVNFAPWKRSVFDHLSQIDEFANGWFDTISCVLANRRERNFLSRTPNYSLEKDTKVSKGPMYRNLIAVLQLTSEKLDRDATRISDIDTELE